MVKSLIAKAKEQTAANRYVRLQKEQTARLLKQAIANAKTIAEI